MPPDPTGRRYGAGWHDTFVPHPASLPPPLPPPADPAPTTEPEDDAAEEEAVAQLLAQFKREHAYLLNLTPGEQPQTPANGSMRGGH